MKLEELYKVGTEIHGGEYKDDKFITRRTDTQVFERTHGNTERKYYDSGIITKDPVYWKMTPKTRRRKIDNEYYISLMKLS